MNKTDYENKAVSLLLDGLFKFFQKTLHGPSKGYKTSATVETQESVTG